MPSLTIWCYYPSASGGTWTIEYKADYLNQKPSGYPSLSPTNCTCSRSTSVTNPSGDGRTFRVEYTFSSNGGSVYLDASWGGASGKGSGDHIYNPGGGGGGSSTPSYSLTITKPPKMTALERGKTYTFEWTDDGTPYEQVYWDYKSPSSYTAKIASNLRAKKIEYTIPSTWEVGSVHELYVNNNYDSSNQYSDRAKYLIVDADNQPPDITRFQATGHYIGGIPHVEWTLYDKEDFPVAQRFTVYKAAKGSDIWYTSSPFTTMSGGVPYRAAGGDRSYDYHALPSGWKLNDGDRLIYRVDYLDVRDISSGSYITRYNIHPVATAYFGDRHIRYATEAEAKAKPYIVGPQNTPPTVDITEVGRIPCRVPFTFDWVMADEDGDEVVCIDAVITCDGKVYRPPIQDSSTSCVWTPPRELAGKTAWLTVTVTDGKESANDTISFEIYYANMPPVPVIHQPERMKQSEGIEFVWTASDVDNDPITLVSAVIQTPNSTIPIPASKITRNGNEWKSPWTVTAKKGETVKLTVVVSDGNYTGSTYKTWVVDAPRCNVAYVHDGVIIRGVRIAYVKDGVITQADAWVHAVLDGKVV